MRKRGYQNAIISAAWFFLFLLFTAVVLTVDVQPIGPDGSRVGLATVNQILLEHLGMNMIWYKISEFLGLVALLVAVGFAVLGVFQMIRRRGVRHVDKDILALAAFYVALVACYAFFEVVVINYRPILMDGLLEASYPSSHVMLVTCIMSSAVIQFQHRISNRYIRLCATIVSVVVIAITIIGRLLSGVHWFTDVVGGLLLSAALVTLYYAVSLRFGQSNTNNA